MNATSEKARPAPVVQSERILSLDVLRGFALLGILTMNVGAFSMPAAAYFDPSAYGTLTGLNGWVWRLNYLLADLKFMAIFSMLFGAGIILMAERCEIRGSSPAWLHYRRMFWLIVFGLLHAHLLWYGDILYWYGMCGLIVYLFRKLSPRWLIVLGLASFSVASGFLLLGGLTTELWPPEALEAVTQQLKPPAEVNAAEIATYQGGWLEQMDQRVPKSIEMQTSSFLSWALWRVSGLMLIGMALFKLGVFGAAKSTRYYGTLIGLALVVGLPVIGYGIHWNVSRDWESPGYFFLGHQFNYWASLLVALGWIGVIMLICKARPNALSRSLSAVGQMAFSNYILQTLICTTIFYGHGFGLFGRVDRVGQLGIVVAVWVFQLIVSPLWLARFSFGPLEWVWRSLVYLRLQPFRR